MKMMMASPEIRMDWVPRRLKRGDKITVKITLGIPEGYHIQAHKPAEELMIPTNIVLEGAKDLTVGEPVYPEPTELPVSWSEVKILTYEGKINIAVPVQVAKDAKLGGIKIVGKLSYQSCTANACLPPREQGFALAFEII